MQYCLSNNKGYVTYGENTIFLPAGVRIPLQEEEVCFTINTLISLQCGVEARLLLGSGLCADEKDSA